VLYRRFEVPASLSLLTLLIQDTWHTEARGDMGLGLGIGIGQVPPKLLWATAAALVDSFDSCRSTAR